MVTVKLEDEDKEIKKARRRIRNQKRTKRRQRQLDRLHEDVGESHDYSNNDLHNIINIGRDAHTVIISKHQECKEAEAYCPSSNSHIIDDHSKPARKRPNIRAHDSEVGVSRPTPPLQQGRRAALIQERFERSHHNHCPWHPSGKHSTYECRNLRHALGAPTIRKNHIFLIETKCSGKSRGKCTMRTRRDMLTVPLDFKSKGKYIGLV